MANILPPVEFATITGRFMVAGNDSSDPGAEADIVPAKGKGSITPSVGYVLVSGSTPPATIKLATIDFEIDSEGYISDAKTKERNVEVIAPSEAVNPSAFTYRINFDGGLFPGFDFHAVPGSTIDLTHVGRVATSVGVAITRGEPGVGIESMTLAPDQASLVVTYEDGVEQQVAMPTLGEVATYRDQTLAAKQAVDDALDQANVFAQDQVPPYLQEAALSATYAGRELSLVGDHEPGLKIEQQGGINSYRFGIYIKDDAANKGRLFKMDHYGGQAGAAPAAFALDIQNYPGSGAAVVVHQYSNYQSAVIIDNTDSRAAVTMRNVQNDTINPGNWGTGDYFRWEGYPAGAQHTASSVSKLGTLDQDMTFNSYDTGKPFRFKAVGHTGPALRVDASHAGMGVAIYGTGTGAGAHSLMVHHNTNSAAGVAIVGGANLTGFTLMEVTAQNFGATITTTSGVAHGHALMVRPNGALGRGLVVRTKSANNAIEVENGDGGGKLFAVSASGLPHWYTASNVQSTVGAAGAAAALPATPSKYLKVIGDDGTTYVIPAYAAT